MDTSSLAKAEPSWKWLKRGVDATRWSLIRRVQNTSAPRATEADEEFCRCYWFPLYCFLRRKGYAEPDAQDHVQAFFAELLTSPMLARAVPEKGRFKNYLLTLFERHVASRRKYERAFKRGGKTPHVPFDFVAAEEAYAESLGQSDDSEDAFRKALAMQLVTEGIEALEDWYAARGKQALLAELLPALEGPLPDTTYAEVGARHGMTSGAVAMAVRQIRERFKKNVIATASRLIGLPPGERLEAELAGLFSGEKNTVWQ